jgi:CheY-like chemotaxis protein
MNDDLKLKHILIVDDEEFIALMYQEKLKLGGFTAQIAANVDEAIKTLKAGGIDLMILDYKLDLLSGAELLDIIAGDDSISPVPVLVVTSFDDASIRNQFSKRGIAPQDILLKPSYTPEQIVEKVREKLSV